MQDRFKFRFWSIKDKQCIDWRCYMQTACNRGYAENPYGLLYSLWTNSKDFISQQCTGLKDKNGKLIYEGDIVKYRRTNPVETGIGIVNCHTCYFSLDFTELGKYEESGLSLTKNTTDYTRLVVIGNIYENPELLENKR